MLKRRKRKRIQESGKAAQRDREYKRRNRRIDTDREKASEFFDGRHSKEALRKYGLPFKRSSSCRFLSMTQIAFVLTQIQVASRIELILQIDSKTREAIRTTKYVNRHGLDRDSQEHGRRTRNTDLEY